MVGLVAYMHERSGWVLIVWAIFVALNFCPAFVPLYEVVFLNQICFSHMSFVICSTVTFILPFKTLPVKVLFTARQ